MQLKQFTVGGLLSIVSLNTLALMDTQQVQINNFKPFLVITIVALVLGAMAIYQKHLQHR
ncbi:hypothetical protein BHECKSOX2_1082 [Bathymodiolus heckerae thiotrophic gill symbiont]|uniref:hypothetical protein n=1 Tax=Bathymodiolus heckerae thiotrophic gill symbiont TaxID=1052212 RepID=UPI0010B7794F|nr:hypothetical protein [Bathymodiolus heckerae thiotrophic gill symbiont]SMN13891.1 hypothetical protein BHECKSOX2_1082 [Bathymodiolus heckerae thiotrophic gill symbiont]